MSDGVISKIKLPNGNTYEIQDKNVELYDTYDDDTKTVTLVAGSLGNADSTEY